MRVAATTLKAMNEKLSGNNQSSFPTNDTIIVLLNESQSNGIGFVKCSPWKEIHMVYILKG